MKRNHSTIMANITRRCALLLVVALIASFVCVGSVSAETTSEATRMNVMLVIDGSGSLTANGSATDPNGYRYDAIDLFLALLTEQGNNVGAVVFNGRSEDMPLESDITELNGKDPKMALSDKIKKAGTGGYTNIGAALLKGVQNASDANKQNGLPSVVILFSDGQTEVPGGKSELNASLKAKEDAIVLAQQENIPVYTICLSVNNSGGQAEMQEIAERCSGQYVKVDNASALTQGFETFYKIIFGSSGTVIQKATFPADGILNFDFDIPAYGAEEVNVILDTRELKSTTITTPSGVLTDEQVESYTMSGGYYDVVKLVNPTPGSWHIQLQGIPEKSATVNILFNIDSDVSLTTRENKTDYSVGETATLCANLIRNGQAVLDPSVTTDYVAKVTLINNMGGEPQEFDMVPDGQGNFLYSFQTSEYTSYTASARVYCGDLEFSTGNVTLNFGNTSPVASPADLDIKKVIWPFFGRSYSTNVSNYFSDGQDATLSYNVVSSQLVQDSFTFDGQTGQLDVNLGASRSGTLVIQATDSQGATAQMNLNFRITDLTYWISGTLLIILLVVALLIASAVAAVMNIPWHGELTVRNLSTGIDKVHADFRGTLPLKKLNIGKCTVDGKFKSVGRNNLMFVSKKDVYTSKSTAPKATKKVTLTSGTTSIYHDEAKTSGITITVVPRTNKAGGFGGMGGMGGRTPRRGASNSSKTKVKSNPFA